MLKKKKTLTYIKSEPIITSNVSPCFFWKAFICAKSKLNLEFECTWMDMRACERKMCVRACVRVGCTYMFDTLSLSPQPSWLQIGFSPLYNSKQLQSHTPDTFKHTHPAPSLSNKHAPRPQGAAEELVWGRSSPTLARAFPPNAVGQTKVYIQTFYVSNPN